MSSAPLVGRPEDCLQEGGELGALMRAKDWSRTAIGPVASWPQSLRTAVSMCLQSEFTTLVCWGRELTMLYNTAYVPVLGSKHPRALGKPLLEVFPEIEDMLRPMFGSVMSTGKAIYAEDLLFPLERHGFVEECYFTFCYSGIRDESGEVGGVLVTCTETTKRVLSERRLRALRKLGEGSVAATASEAWNGAADALRAATHDVPAFALYEARADETFELRAPERAHALLAPSGPARETLAPDAGFVAGPWPEPVRTIARVPIGKGARPIGVLVVAASPRLAFDDDQRSFLQLVAEQVAASVTNAKAREEERRRVEALAELDRAKTTFFHNISHEFRTPLTLQLGPIADALADARDPLPARQRERIETVQRNALRLLKLVNSLLDFSRIEAGRAKAQLRVVDVARLTRDIASGFESTMRRAGLDYRIETPREPVPAAVDPDMWEKIVLNLVSNAYKFTQEGRVVVRVVRVDAGARLVVEDSGCGIAPEHHARVFERFHRVEGRPSRSHESSGIGLALVSDLVKLHGATIRLESDAGQGARFTIDLPPPPEGARAVPVDVPLDPVTTRGVLAEASRWTGETPEDAERGRDAARSTVLVADDNADMRAYVRSILEAEHRVLLAAQGEEAMRIAREERPALVLADVMMPGMDGLALVHALRADERTRGIPVILLSARAGTDEAALGLEAGADDYIVKPFAASELLARVRAHVSLARQRDESARRVREILDQLPDGFFAFDHAWRVTYQNPVAMDLIHAGTNGRERDLQGFDLFERFPELDSTGFGEMYRRAMAERVPLHMEEYYPPFDRWYEAFAYPISGGLAIYVRDATKRKQDEHALEATKRALAQSERMAALSGLVSALAHEIRTPLTIVQTNAQVLAARAKRAQATGDHAPLAAVTPAIVDDITAAIARANETIGRLKRFTRAEAQPRAREPLDAIARDALDVLASAYRARGGIVAKLDKTRPFLADRTQVQQIVINLVQNAVEATQPEASPILVETRQEGDAAVLLVTDAGPGISETVRERMFDPLFTTKAEGTGLGLSIVLRAAQDHGGTVACISRPGRTVFRVEFPTALAPEGDAPLAPAGAS